ncbi:MAG: hypothetical protein ABSD77_07795 [Verrucomicrobiota bacterium]|jgi:hypothetical protein
MKTRRDFIKAGFALGASLPLANLERLFAADLPKKTASVSAAPVQAKSILLITAANYALKDYVLQSMASAKSLGYELLVYDLGMDKYGTRLGFGIPFPVDNESFQKDGFYVRLLNGFWASQSLFKPLVVEHAMASHPTKFIVWLDADARVIRPIDDIVGDYDIGVTTRKPSVNDLWRWANAKNHVWEKYSQYIGELGAGVIFFAPTDAARAFVGRWKAKTQELQDDQFALNQLINPRNEQLMHRDVLIRDYTEGTLRFRTFPAEHYNCYSSRKPGADVRIVHYKGKGEITP